MTMQTVVSDCLAPVSGSDDDDSALKYNRHQRRLRRLPQSTRRIALWGLVLTLILATSVLGFMVYDIYDDGNTVLNNRQLLQEDTESREVLSKMASIYYALSPDPTIAEDEIRELFASEDEELVEEIMMDAKQTRDKKQKETRRETASERSLDKHIRNLEYVADNCLGEEDTVVDFNLLPEKEAIKQAQHILRNCKLLILRNAISRDYLDKEVIPRASVYLNGLAEGKVSHQGTTTNGEGHFLGDRNAGRWEVLLPRSLVNATKEELVLNRRFLSILKEGNILGNRMSLMSGGINFESPGAVGQYWHEDDTYLLETNSFDRLGIAGHDTPGVAVTMSIPLLDMTPVHGPTEFCLGSSTLQGILEPTDEEGNFGRIEDVRHRVKDKRLVAPGSVFDRFTKHGYLNCHPDFWKSPILAKGDVLFFDYQLRHRGGWNSHRHDARAIMFFTYSRYWFKDSNFQEDPTEETNMVEHQILEGARMAQPSNWEEFLEQHDSRQDLDEAINPIEIGPIEPFQNAAENQELYGSQGHVFFISNKDVQDGDVYLYWNEERLNALNAGETVRLFRTVRPGDLISLRSSERKLREFPARYGGQVVFHSKMTAAE